MLWSKPITGPILLLGVLAIFIGGCGFKPVYYGDDGRDVALTMAAIEIAPISDRTGQIIRNELQNLITPRGRPRNPEYVLNVDYTESVEKTAVERTAFATRGNVRLETTFNLMQRNGGEVIASTKILSISSYNIFEDPYATLIAENDARERAAKDAANAIARRVSSRLSR